MCGSGQGSRALSLGFRSPDDCNPENHGNHHAHAPERMCIHQGQVTDGGSQGSRVVKIGCTYQQQGHRHAGPSSNVFDWDEELQPSQERQKHVWEHNAYGVEERSPPHLCVDWNSPQRHI